MYAGPRRMKTDLLTVRESCCRVGDGHGLTRLVLALALLAGMTLTARAAPGIDAVLLIDQSGSMSRNDGSAEGNDLFGHRVALCRLIIERLIDEDPASPRINRVAVVEFGSHAILTVDNLVVADPAARARSARAAREIANRLAATHMGNTNTPEAFALAIQAFNHMAAAEGAAPRERHLLILTDGHPYVTGATQESIHEAMRQHGRELALRGVSVWVVGFNESGNYWQVADRQLWEGIAGDPGRVNLLGMPLFPAVMSAAQHIGDLWLGAASTPVAGTVIEVPPYLRRLEVDVHYAETTQPGRLVGPSGQIAPTTGASTAALGVANAYRVDNPLPGTYRVEAPPNISNWAAVREQGPRLYLLEPGDEVGRDIDTRVRIQMAGDDPNVPIAFDPAWPVEATVTVTDPAGGTVILPARMAEHGQFVATWRPATPGRHTLALAGTVHHADGRSFDLMRGGGHDPFAVQVAQHAPYALVWLEPDPAETRRISPLAHGMTLRVRLVEGVDQRVANLAEAVPSPGAWLRAQVIDAEGRPVPGIEPLTFTAGDGEFTLDLPLAFDLTAGEGWLSPVALNLRLEPAGPMVEGRAPSELRLPPGSEGRRILGDRLTVAGLQASYNPWLLWGGLAVLLALLAGGVLLLFRIQYPQWRIRSEDRKRGKPITLLIEKGSPPSAAAQPIKVDLTGRRRVRHVRRYSVSDEGRKVILEKLAVERTPAEGGRPTATIIYALEGQKTEFRETLTAGPESKPLKGLKDNAWHARLVVGKPPISHAA